MGVLAEFQFRWPVTREAVFGRSSYEKHYAYARLHNFKWHAHNKPPTNFHRQAKSNQVKTFLYLFCLTNQACVRSSRLVNYLTSHPTPPFQDFESKFSPERTGTQLPGNMENICCFFCHSPATRHLQVIRK